MRWRIGLLQDSAALERQAARDAAKKEADKIKAQTPTVKTEAQTKAEEEAASKPPPEEKPPPKPRIKPLSETKAIESGANFISETFLFGVAAGLIIFESWRSGRKEKNRRDKVAERISDLEDENKAARQALVELEREVLTLRVKDKSISNGDLAKARKILPAEVYELVKSDNEDDGSDDTPKGWFSNITSVFRSEKVDEEAEKALATDSPGPAEKLLQESDKVLEERRRQREAEEVEQTEATSIKAKR